MTTSFSTALKQGYSVMYALQIEGIPYIFVEKKFPKITADTSPTAAYYTTVEGLIVDESSNLGVEIDRETGVARGQAATFTLAFQAMSDLGYLDDIFSRPSGTEVSRLTGDLTQASTTILAADTAGFPAAGSAYLGKEYFNYSGKTSNSFTGVSRGQVGNKYVHHANSPSNYGIISKKPIIWRGRYVTLWEHLVTPDGRLLSSSWMDTSDWGREAWKGYIEEAAMPGVVGMGFTCLPLVRKLTQPVGLEIAWEMKRAPYKNGHYMTTSSEATTPVMHLSPTDEIDFGYTHDGTKYKLKVTGFSGNDYRSSYIMTERIAAEIQDTSSQIDEVFNHPSQNTGDKGIFHYLSFKAASGSAISKASIVSAPGRGPYFLENEKMNQQSLFNAIVLRFKENWASKDVLPWLVLEQLSGKASEDYVIPATGLGFMSADDKQELVSWTDGQVPTDYDPCVVKISERALGGSELCNPFKHPTKLETAVGSVGKLGESMLRIVESSGGAGHFGTYDTLDVGFGLAIPSTYINTDSFTNIHTNPYAQEKSTSAFRGRSSFEELYGGWLAIQGLCLVQKRQSDGTIKLECVEHSVGEFSSYAAAVTIYDEDVLLDKIENLNLISSPNQVVIKTSSDFAPNAPEILVRDVPKVQVEGAVAWEMVAPGLEAHKGITRAKGLIAESESYYSLRIPIAPWVEIHPGDMTVLSLTSHPLLYDYAAGERGASNVAARCIGVEKSLVDQVQYCTFLLFGTALPPVLLAPTVTVGSKVGATVTLASGEGKWFIAGDKALLYTEGGEATEIETLTISSVSGDALVFTTTPSSWVAGGTRITYPKHTVATSLQDDYMYNIVGKVFL